MKNSHLTLLCLLFSVLCTPVQARSLDDIKESHYIVIAVYSDYLPFSAQIQGQAVGIDVDIARHIAQTLKLELRLKWMTADESTEDDLRNNLWKGHFIDKTKADVMMRVPYDKDYSLKRDDVGLLVHEQVHMFAPYHTETWQIMFNHEQIEAVPTMALFQYHPIGVEIDSIPQFYLMSAFRGSMRKNTHQFASLALAVEGMQSQNVDAVMGLRSQISALHYSINNTVNNTANNTDKNAENKLKTTKKYRLAENAFPLLGKQKWDIGLAVHTDFRALAYEVGDIVTAMMNDGSMKMIFKTHHVIFEGPEYYMQ